MNIGISTGYLENYWAGWPWVKMYGGSEHLACELACALAEQGHNVTVRLPYVMQRKVWRGVEWVSLDSPSREYDRLFLFDDFRQRDRGDVDCLVACRSDPPPHTEYDQLIFLSQHHARLMGHEGRPAVGGGVNLADYAVPKARLPRRVICCSSPDRCPKAAAIGKEFDFRHSYKPVPGFNTVELDRDGLKDLQQTAMVGVYPYGPSRESDFFSMSTLEMLAAGTPVLISDGPSLVELWGDVAIVLPRPIDVGQWYSTTEELLEDPVQWRVVSNLGRLKARDFVWPLVAQRYLDAATS